MSCKTTNYFRLIKFNDKDEKKTLQPEFKNLTLKRCSLNLDRLNPFKLTTRADNNLITHSKIEPEIKVKSERDFMGLNLFKNLNRLKNILFSSSITCEE
ncbi:hypothetical protein BpHYR1_016518 [Brachionus plicatilis]|uniref:Uncharacterized protein n=1 Tax=Brachionus plicatilis TaxID=10195 RepID=A0A3M7R784_BRAPC|nr:hypothetical protein BpHYR1_016518 [Brachionus plicatilis]